MTVHVAELIGNVAEARFEGRAVVQVPVAWDEASRRRLRRSATDGTDVTIDLRGGGYLSDGAVLAADDQRVLVVARLPEPALVVSFDLSLPPAHLVAQALALGHAFGNQHVPVDIAEGEARIPLTTSEAIARATVQELGLDGAVMEVAEVKLGSRAPMSIGHSHSD
jgi:urease accessory protein